MKTTRYNKKTTRYNKLMLRLWGALALTSGVEVLLTVLVAGKPAASVEYAEKFLGLYCELITSGGRAGEAIGRGLFALAYPGALLAFPIALVQTSAMIIRTARPAWFRMAIAAIVGTIVFALFLIMGAGLPWSLMVGAVFAACLCWKVR